MATEMKARNVSYWSARFLMGRTTLQQAIVETKKKLPQWSERVEPMTSNLAPDGSVFLNEIMESHGMVFAQMIMFEQGRHHAALNMAAATKPSLDLIEVAPTIGNARARAEFLESILYFGVKDNHIVLLQSQALRSRDLENYLNVLLLKSEAIDKADDSLSLEKGVAAATKDRIAKETASKIRIGTDLFTGKSTVQSKDDPDQAGRKRVKLTGGVMGLLNKLSGNSLDDVVLDNSIDQSSIRVYVELSYKKKKDVEAGKVMEDLTHSLRHLHEDDVAVTLPKTGTLRGNKLYVSTQLRVQAKNGNIVEVDLHKAMSAWLQTLLSGKIVDG